MFKLVEKNIFTLFYAQMFCLTRLMFIKASIFELVHEISNNVVCATSKASDQPAHTRSLIRAFASHLNIL